MVGISWNSRVGPTAPSRYYSPRQCILLNGKQEVALNRKVPLAVSRAKDKDLKRRAAMNTPTEPSFLVTETELRDRKIKRRQKHKRRHTDALRLIPECAPA